MCVDGTPVEDHRAEWGLWVKREDLCCPGGPNFSKTRGVWAHIAKRPERVIGVLDTVHSQGGHAVARACKELGKYCVEFYPVRKSQQGWFGEVQEHCRDLGALTIPLQAGRSAVLYSAAKKRLNAEWPDSFFMPNALKLPEMVTETAAEVARTQAQMPVGSDRDLMRVRVVLISASSGTIAAGVLLGLLQLGWSGELVVHQGYSRSQDAMRRYMDGMIAPHMPGHPGGGGGDIRRTLVDEGYSYADAARPGPTPKWPLNVYYDLKAFQWWVKIGREKYGEALMWSIG